MNLDSEDRSTIRQIEECMFGSFNNVWIHKVSSNQGTPPQTNKLRMYKKYESRREKNNNLDFDQV